MRFDVISLFPEMFEALRGQGLQALQVEGSVVDRGDPVLLETSIEVLEVAVEVPVS